MGVSRGRQVIRETVFLYVPDAPVLTRRAENGDCYIPRYRDKTDEVEALRGEAEFPGTNPKLDAEGL